MIGAGQPFGAELQFWAPRSPLFGAELRCTGQGRVAWWGGRCVLLQLPPHHVQSQYLHCPCLLTWCCARKLPVADRPDLPTVLHAMADAMGPEVDPEMLLAATVGHLAISGSAA